MHLKSFSEALKGKQHKLDADKDGKIEAEDLAKLRGEDEGGSVDRVARSDYKVSASGRKTHKQITFREDQEVSEEKMTDSEMKKREDYVKGMKKNLSSFKDKYGERAKDVMYATATKMAMKEDTDLEEGYIVKYHAADGEHKNSSKVFNDKAKAEKHAVLGNSINKVGGRYTVHKIDSEGRAVKEEVELDEAMSPQKQMDFDRMMKGAMSRAAYNAKWKKPLKSDEKVIYGKNVKEETETEEKHEMAQTQLHFITYAAEEILDYIDMGGEIEEWYQNKLSKIHSDMESLHSQMEGEKRRAGMVDEEVEQIGEAANRKLMIGSNVTHPDHGKGKVRNIIKDVVIVRYDKKVNGTTVSGYHTKKDIKKMVVDEQTTPAANAPKMVRDRKTGEMYDPQKKFKELMDKPETKATMNRLAKEEAELEEGVVKTYGPVTSSHKAAASKVFNAGVKHGKAGAPKDKTHMSSALFKTTYLNGYKQGMKEEADLGHNESVNESADVESIRDRIESLRKDLKAVRGSYPGDDRNRSLIRSEIFRAKEQLKAASSKKQGVKEEVEQIDELSKKTLGSYVKKAASSLDATAYAAGRRGEDDDYIKSMKRRTGIEKASDRLAKEEFEIEEQAPVAPTLDRKYIKGTPEHKAHKATKKPINGHPTNVKEQFNSEGTDMAEKITFGDFIAKMNEQLLEYESDDSGVYRHTKKATYGTSYQGDDDEDEKKPKQPAEKRGRGRPAGAKSGARKITGTSKLYK